MASTFALLADHPEIARLRHEVDPPIRVHRYRSHLVFFDATPEGVEIVRVLHGRVDWRAVLD
ncbi:type II toxin-antitoxin system RelE/ParE family toxin [Jannaschia formosa]|uniref:type II toxin-antitoxin system RelE/ParE family toxin n=1 Tax=Jannaschia formosa TaxID=2259592 RepID=UPI003520C1FB